MPEQRKTEQQDDPVTDYLSHLLSAQGEVEGQSVNWDDLLSDAVRRGKLEDAINASTSRPGFAPVKLMTLGAGNRAEHRTQLFHILHHAGALPQSRLRRHMLASAIPFIGEAILNE